MAGIGFKLQKMLTDDTGFGTISAYLYAATISSGPWLFTIVSIGCLGIFSSMYLSLQENLIFKSLIVYSYAFSLIITGTIQMVTTRFVSDRFFDKDDDAVLPTYITAVVLTTVIQTAIGTIFYSFFDFEMRLKVLAVLLYTVISDIWIAMIFLTTLQNYKGILNSFLLGATGSLLGGAVLGKFFAFYGMLTGFIAGQSMILLFLTRNIVCEFKCIKSVSREYIHYFARFPQLAIIGFSYNLAIWIDKLLFWFGEPGEKIANLLYFCPVYDTTIYFAYILIVPSLALFIIRLETSFYHHYMDFYNAISNRLPLWVIKEKKQEVINSIYTSLQQVLRLQGLITLFAILFAYQIIDLLNMQIKLVAIFRISTLGVFLHVLLLFLTIIVLYFDFRNLCMFIALQFLFTNATFTYITIQLGFQFYGYGYMLSCLFTLIIGFILFTKKINNLEYLTFMQQPVISASE